MITDLKQTLQYRSEPIKSLFNRKVYQILSKLHKAGIDNGEAFALLDEWVRDLKLNNVLKEGK